MTTTKNEVVFGLSFGNGFLIVRGSGGGGLTFGVPGEDFSR